MSKRELIDAIIKHNSTAAPEFLARFAESDLKAYLDRVCMIHPPAYVLQLNSMKRMGL
jgi:hypothetical protein